MRFRLTRAEARSVTAVATVRVAGDRVVVRREIRRGEILGADDVRLARGEWSNVPLRRLPTIDQVIGSRARRPLPAEAVVLPGAVTFRRAVEPGDRVTVLAVSGGVEVSASLVAANGGEPGDVIRVINPDTKRDVRARVLKAGVVEVSHAR
jgi:flagella basal body P-ring formation protein FlgA